MNGACIKHTELPGCTRLFADLLYDFPKVERFYAHDPSDAGSMARAHKQIDYPMERRAAVVSALRNLNEGNPSLELLARDGVTAVLTGQQVGLYGGPAYTLYKALTAIRVAQELTAAGNPSVPIFWLATEDHDVEEVRSAAFWDGGVTADASSDGRPAGNHLLAGLPETLPLSEGIRTLAERHYANGRSFGDAFLGLVKELLGPLGLLFADPLDPALRAAGEPILAEAARRSAELSSAILERDRELLAGGYHAMVHFEEKQTSLFFLLENGRRQQLKFNGENFLREGVEITPDALAAEGVALSPNALLRPVWQDYLFPTVALIGGPGELAYFAQAEALYRMLLGRMPVIMPRAFFTILDAKSEKIIDRYRVRYVDMLQGEEQVRETLGRRLIPPDLTDTLQHTETSVVNALARLEAKLEGFDPTLARAMASSRTKVKYQFSKNQSKIVREVLRKDEQASRHADHISHRLAPHGHLQERHYSLLALLSDYGLEFIPKILANIHVECHDHQVLLLA